MHAITIKNAWLMYKIPFNIDGKISWDKFWAVKDVSFTVDKGEVLGIIGENGAGKSTVLKLIAGLLKPDRGQVEVSGRVAGLLELGAGFQPELTGSENISLSANLFGLTQDQIQARHGQIVEFASLGRFIYAPVKCYSQGMFVRLAFAIAIHMEPGILLIDDTLAVGDEYFQKKCIMKIFELKEQGATIVFICHDMHLLRRLCKRTVLLKDGRVIKNDLADKVIPLYTQTQGEKGGVEILTKDKLLLTFNNGRLFINWQDTLISPGSGIYSSFRHKDRWYSSVQADWRLQKIQDNRLVAQGVFEQLGLTQKWILEIGDNFEVSLDITIDTKDFFDVQEGFINVMLSKEYTEWFSPLEKGEFASTEEKIRSWKPYLPEDVSRRCIGLKAEQSDAKDIPSFVLEQAEHAPGVCAQIFDTDYATNCRLLQYKILGLYNYSPTQANILRLFSGKIMFNIANIDLYLKDLEEEFTLSTEKARLMFENGKCIIFWKGENLTKASHMNTLLYANGRWYSSCHAQWKLFKQEKDVLVACGSWPNLPVIQTWRLGIAKQKSFFWEVGLEIEKDVNIAQQHLRFMGKEDYEYWFSDYGRGIFPAQFLDAETDVLQRCIPSGAFGIQSNGNHLPAIVLKFSKQLGNFAKIFNSDIFYRARILRIDKVEPENKRKFVPGKYSCFSVELALPEKGPLPTQSPTGALQRKNLKFVFDNGSGCLFWKDRQLTKELGLYTSLRAEGRWHDSRSKAVWDIIDQTADKITACGRWLYLPIRQTWTVKLQTDNIIEFIVGLCVEKEISFDRIQTNIMVSENYKRWYADAAKGQFPEFQRDIDCDWQSIWAGKEEEKKDNGYIAVTNNGQTENLLPDIKMLCPSANISGALNIINSDIYHRARVLQHLKKREMSFSPGQYPYYQGQIVIEGA